MTEVSSSDLHDGLSAMYRGMILLAAGGALIIAIHYFWGPGPGPFHRYTPLLLSFAGAYAVVVGLEKMVSGFRFERRTGGPADRRRAGLAGAAGLALLVLLAVGGWAVYVERAPYREAVSDLNAGDLAAARLRTIGERHAAKIESGASGEAALRSWKEAAAEALPLRPQFAAALEAARYLARDGDGAVKERGELDTKFHALCLEWMDLYARVLSQIEQASMTEPPLEWGERLNNIVERIQALPQPGQEGSPAS